jgi:hypothetical protein
MKRIEDSPGSGNRIRILFLILLICLCGLHSRSAPGSGAGMDAIQGQNGKPDNFLFYDAHVHLTNYIQKGPDIHKFLEVMGDKVGRATLFGIPLQQQWSYANTGSFAPWYYTQTDAPLYYYSFTDAYIAMAYKSLKPEEQARLDPMITGFNPADMYAADHIRRVLTVFPGVFSGIGEFTIHKEFVSAKIPGEVANLNNPSLDSILSFAAETGLLVLIHSDIDMPFPKQGQEPYQVMQFGIFFSGIRVQR